MSITNNISESSTSIHIAWERVACSQRNGEIDGYNVTYYPEGNSSDKTTATVYGVTESNRIFLASGLQPLTNYIFKVLAFNTNITHGYGPAASATFQTSVAEGIRTYFVLVNYNCLNVFFVDVGFFLDGNLYPNNSLVDLDEIGSGTKALFCLTNNINCCENPSQGDWFGPTIRTVEEMDTTDDFYTSRGRSVIYLNKVATSSSQTQSGVFYCRIPDDDGNNRTIYIGIYNNEEGRIKVRIFKKFQMYSLMSRSP